MTPEQYRALAGDLERGNGGRYRSEVIADTIAALRAAADQLEAVRMRAGIHAVAAHALGRSEQERDWLDILAIIPPDTAPQEDRDE